MVNPSLRSTPAMASPAPEEAAEKSERAAQEQSSAVLLATDPAAGAQRDDDAIADGAEATPPAEDQEKAKETDSHPATQTDLEDGEVEPSAAADAAPPPPNEPTPAGPPLPSEPVPSDDGWDCQFDARTQAWFFYNRFTGKSQWDNPRVPTSTAVSALPPPPPAHEQPAAGGYNPAIHGDYDPNAWYAQGGSAQDEDGGEQQSAAADDDLYAATATFNRFSGGFQDADATGRHTDEAKSHRQMNAYFDADAAAAAHDGRSLRAERQGKRPSKAEVKAFKEKRRARKEEKRRAWLRD